MLLQFGKICNLRLDACTFVYTCARVGRRYDPVMETTISYDELIIDLGCVGCTPFLVSKKKK